MLCLDFLNLRVELEAIEIQRLFIMLIMALLLKIQPHFRKIKSSHPVYYIMYTYKILKYHREIWTLKNFQFSCEWAEAKL